MPDVSAGLTYASDENGRAPEAPLDHETEAAVAQIKAQSQAARETPSNDGFSKQEIVDSFFAPTGIEAGLRTADDDALDKMRADTDAFMDTPEMVRVREEREQMEQDAAFGRAARRMADVVGPALQTLENSYDDTERAAALVQLSPTERQLAINEGVLDPDEVDELVAIGASILEERQVVSARMGSILSDAQAATDRGERWDAIKSEFGLGENEAQALLGEAVRRVSELGHSLGALPADSWEAAVRHTYGSLHAEDIAREKAAFKDGILNAETTSIESGLTEAGRPVVPPMRVYQAPDYSLAEMLASGRNRPMTDDEIRHGVLHAHEDTSVEHNVVEGSLDVPASVRQKMTALFGR